MSEIRKKSFVLYHNYFNQLLMLNMMERGELITAIFQYETCGKQTMELSPLADMLFSIIKDTLDRDREQYLRVCEINKENGKKGGRPKKQKIDEETERFFEKPKKPDNDNENDIDIDIDIDSDIDNGKEKEIEHSPTPAPQEMQKIKKYLLKKGVTEEYIDKRLDRAIKYASYKNVSVSEILLEWWRADQGRPVAKRSLDLPDYEDVKDKPIEECDENEIFIKQVYHFLSTEKERQAKK